MYIGLSHLHSSMRYLVLIGLLLTVVLAFIKWRSNGAFGKPMKITALVTLIFSHIQLLVGIVLYFVSPIVEAALADFGAAMKESVLRFYSLEHALAMIIAIVLITRGYSLSKKSTADKAKHGYLAAYYGAALVIIFFMIPWPFLRAFGSWM